MDIQTAYTQPIMHSKPLAGAKLTAEQREQFEDQKIRAKCYEFQAVLFSCMMKSMRETVDKSGLFYGGRAEDFYTAMLDEEYAKIMSKNTQNSIAETLYKQFTRSRQHKAADTSLDTKGVIPDREE